MLAIITAIHLLALGQIEGGADNIAKHGKAGEITRFQILPRELHAHGYGTADVETYGSARIVVRRIWTARVTSFAAAHGRQPTAAELYLLWHRPARVLHPRPLERERAERFAALVIRLQGNGFTRITR